MTPSEPRQGRGCACLVTLGLAILAWGIVILALIGAVEVVRRVLGLT